MQGQPGASTDDTGVSLATAYAEWEHSMRLLEQIKEFTPAGLPIAVILENALMYRTLFNDASTVKYMFHTVDATAIGKGFSSVGAEFDADLSARVVSVLSTPWPEAVDTVKPSVLIEDGMLCCGQFRQKLVAPVQRLLQSARSKYSEPVALEYVARCALRYAAIYAETRHIGPPQVVYDDFYALGVRNEGFASPFNARLLGKPDATFFSAFADTDGVFGSGGSLFLAERTERPGAWCLDPPFLPELMDRTMEKIQSWRAEPDCPAILLIVPASFSFELKPDETVLLREGTHHYEGLDGEINPLPVDVAIHRFGQLESFSAERVQQGYLPR